MLLSRLLACLLIPSLAMAPSETFGQSTVVVETVNGEHRLTRNGEPYFIKGVGGNSHLELLAASGGNSIRTWSTDNLEEILDEAHKHGLTVCVGLWLGHERHGFDYQNERSVVSQLEQCVAAVRKYKDHPAVLMWGIGNEMEGEGNNPAVWYAVDHIARECKRIDPDHPTMTVIAELGPNENKVRNIERFCPHIDIIGLNSYGGITSLAERYQKAGVSKPYVVTEFGPHGPWEVGKTRWGAPIEVSSTEKAVGYSSGYEKAISSQNGLCLGSYAFLWGHKQETTATWFGMLLPDGSRTGAVDAMTEAWTGTAPKNGCPRIDSLVMDRVDKLTPGESIRAKLTATDPEDDSLTIRWVLRHDSATIGVGGDFQAEEATFKDAVAADGTSAVVTVPEGGGGYRLFAYVSDSHGGAAVTNVPLFVDAPLRVVASKRARLPFTLYSDDSKSSVYAPSGYMGNTAAIKMQEDCQDNPHSGKTCLQVDYSAGNDWGGVLWQSPPNDWTGDKPGGLNLTGAVALEFWARGAKGGEAVDFVLGVIEGDRPYRDSSKSELKGVRLTNKWQKLRIPLKGRDLSRIKTGFGWSLAGQGKPVRFYLDDIRYVDE